MIVCRGLDFLDRRDDVQRWIRHAVSIEYDNLLLSMEREVPYYTVEAANLNLTRGFGAIVLHMNSIWDAVVRPSIGVLDNEP